MVCCSCRCFGVFIISMWWVIWCWLDFISSGEIRMVQGDLVLVRYWMIFVLISGCSNCFSQCCFFGVWKICLCKVVWLSWLLGRRMLLLKCLMIFVRVGCFGFIIQWVVWLVFIRWMLREMKCLVVVFLLLLILFVRFSIQGWVI